MASVRPKQIKPLMCVFDRPKTVALKWQRNGEVTEWNPVFTYVMLELGVGVELCWPHSPQQKGAVENLVGFVKSSFFKVRRFHDQEDLAQQLIEWHREVNQERACRATGIVPAVRLAEEVNPHGLISEFRLSFVRAHPYLSTFDILAWCTPSVSAMRSGAP